jgi:AcrR family transcriptional regulator
VPRLSAERARAQRQRVLDAALVCFARHGFHAATMQDIVRESGLSPGAIYGYFAGKSELVLASADERHAAEKARIEHALDTPDIAVSIARLTEGFIAALREPQERIWRDLSIQLWAESLHDERFRIAAAQGVDQPVKLLARLVRRAQGKPRPPNAASPEAVARVMIATLQGLTLQSAWDPGIDLAACADAIGRLLRAA